MGRKLPLGSPEATLARWAKPLGIEAELGIEKGARLSMEALAAKVAEKISPHPERFTELAAAAQEFEAYLLRREGALLQTCGTPWGRIVRLFWQDRKGRTVMRQRGLHSCKHRWCPRCGKPRQNRLANEIERSTELARAWGFGENNMRFLTVTIPNGKDVSELRQEAHQAWARLQRTRWWPRNVFGWFRGTEVVTGTDGHWNLHLHVVLILWAHQISYSSLWEAWEKAVGKRCQIDVVTLADYRRKAKGRGTTRAARYIVKYITKREVLTNLRNGPGGLAHLFSATRRLRAFAVGG
ncbi:MAG TPA: protein rep, partial [Holophagaceae bacterium]|nr:protein rep [Holophagaceae bacterium]